jgi:hypothetical protein
MSAQITKYQLPYKGENSVLMVVDAEILSCGTEMGNIVVWAKEYQFYEYNIERRLMESRRFYVLQDNQGIPNVIQDQYEFLGTVTIKLEQSYHIFYKK